MKKLIALLLAAAMLLSMTACGGSAEPVETAPATTEPVVQATVVPTEEPTGAPTEAPTEPRVAPTDFEAVDPATLPEPIPVEEQLLSEDTQTVTLGSLEEYEDLLWELGFKEVQLTNTHIGITGQNAWCEPVSLTYNNAAFRLNFVYCSSYPNGEARREEGWYMYGTRSCVLSNVSYVNEEDYIKAETVSLDVIFSDTDQPLTEEELAAILSQSTVSEKTTTSNFEKEFMSFTSAVDKSTSTNVLAVYYPVTGVLLNYAQDIEATGITSTQLNQDDYSVIGQAKTVGIDANYMNFHYVPDAA
jgi:hypothetical protein